VSSNSVIASDFKCEYAKSHYYFDSKFTGMAYVEAHHLIPMSAYKEFKYSIDVEANVVALCPVCHRKFHHAKLEDKTDIIKKIYTDRKERLKNSGIDIVLEDLMELYK
jgi:predicted HNH restriction endonuclease